MHIPSVNTKSRSEDTVSLSQGKNLDFLWLELTNRCNLSCIHCYTESNIHRTERDLLTAQDYESIMSQAYALGCRKIQFIGGEPQLNRDFLHLLSKAKDIGFEFIEVFTNLTHLDNDTLRYSSENGIYFATSVYSAEPSVHDAITKVKSSHAQTIKNLKKLIDNQIETRAGIIVIDQEKKDVERTKQFLRDLGVRHYRESEVRQFGRGEEILSRHADLSGLCGPCWAGKLCIAPDGVAYPCVMAREWPIGNVLDRSLSEIVQGQALANMRQTIFEQVWLPRTSANLSGQHDVPLKHSSSVVGSPDPQCGPDAGTPDCAPEINPLPAQVPEEEPCYEPNLPAEECPQSCFPKDASTCGPMSCPQSCTPFMVVCEPSPASPQSPTQDPEEQPSYNPDETEPRCFPCPQSCAPDLEEPPCEPNPCPQSCTPFQTTVTEASPQELEEEPCSDPASPARCSQSCVPEEICPPSTCVQSCTPLPFCGPIEQSL
jgi:MoaA/NifB/PqqE/SkfB family radical SAM enzyme